MVSIWYSYNYLHMFIMYIHPYNYSHIYIKYMWIGTLQTNFGLWPFRFVAIPVCGHFGLWPFRSVAVLVCSRLGLWPFTFWSFRFVAVMTRIPCKYCLICVLLTHWAQNVTMKSKWPLFEGDNFHVILIHKTIVLDSYFTIFFLGKVRINTFP